MKLAFRRILRAGLLAAFGFLALITGVTWWSARQNTEAFRSVTHTYRVMGQLQDTLTGLLTVETSSRGFAISGDESFLAVYNQSLADIQKSSGTLQGLIADNPVQQQRFAVLEPLIQKKLVRANDVVVRRRQGDEAGARQLVASGAGRQAMDEIRKVVTAMNTEEESLLQQRVEKSRTQSNATLMLVGLGGLAGFLFVGLASIRARRELIRRQQAEEERNRFFTLSLDLLCIAGADGHFKRVNPAFTHTLGWSESEFLARPFIEFVHPDDRAATLREVEKLVIEGRQMLRFDNRYQHKDGSWRILSWKSVPQPGGLMYATARDVTEIRQAEEQLRLANEAITREHDRLQFIFNSAPIGLSYYSQDRTGRKMRLINDAHLRTCGITREQADDPATFSRITHPADQSRQAPLSRQIEDGTLDQYSMDKRYLLPDGATHWVLFTFQRRRYPDGAFEDLSSVVDITERKQLEETLRQSEENLSVTLHSIGDAVLATDASGNVTRMNPIAEKLTGWPQAEALGRPVGDVFNIVNERTRQPAEIPVAKVLATGKVQGLANHTVIIARDGTEFPIADSAAPIRDKDGRVHGVVLVFRDVTEEKQAERALAESERRLRAFNDELEQQVRQRTVELRETNERLKKVLEVETVGVIFWDLTTGAMTDANDTFLNTMGYSRRDVEARELTWQKLTPPEYFEASLAEVKKFAQTGRVGPYEKEYLRKDGSRLWFVFAGSSLGNNTCVEFCVDISARKRAEAELGESERFAHAVLDALTAHVAILDENGVIVATNKSWKDFAGQNELNPARSNEGVNYLEICARASGEAAGTAGKMAQGIREIIAGKRKDFTLEYDCHSPKEKRWFLCRVTRFTTPGPARIVVAHENITQMKLLERQQVRNQRMESLGTLAGGVAHDLNNALAPILMGVQLLKEKYPADSSIVDLFYGSAKRGADMVRQLLTFARGAEGERNPIQLTHLIKEVQNIINSTFPKNIRLEVNYEKSLPPVRGDATQLHQVLLNLCVNARDAMPSGGRLVIDAHSKEVDSVFASSIHDAKPGKYIVLTVRDTGTGISPEIIDRIFDPFFTTKAPDKGTGLGLSTVMGIIKSHGGFIQVYSLPGQGSTFKVFFPAEPKTSDTAFVAKLGTIFHGNGETILFVDDEPALREVARVVLRRLKFKPITAADGLEALVQLTEHKAELCAIITDLHMPHMDGLTYVRAVRRMLPDIPIVISSGRMEEREREEFKSLGVTVQLDKPFTEAQLAEALMKVMPPK